MKAKSFRSHLFEALGMEPNQESIKSALCNVIIAYIKINLKNVSFIK